MANTVGKKDYNNHHFSTIYLKLLKVCVSFLIIGWILNMWVHLLFVMKYWVVTQKVRSIFHKKEYSNLNCIVQAITIFLMVFCFVGIVSYSYFLFYPENLCAFEKWSTITAALVDIPPIIFFCFIAHAFYVMNKYAGSFNLGVSRRQIWLQVASNFAYAVLDPLPTVMPQYTNRWNIFMGLAVVANDVSLIILT